MGKHITSLTIKQKLEIIESVTKKGKSKSELSTIYKCDISTINRILRNSTDIRKIANRKNNIQRKRNRESAYKNVENALLTWFNQIRQQGGIVSGTVLLNKAKEFAIKLNVDFEPNRGWLWRWQKRENIIFKKLHGERSTADEAGANDYVQHILPSILKKYDPRDVFNADESGLFFKALPNFTMIKKNTEMKGHKLQKDRLTLLFICNATGDYKQIIAIGKRQNPRCFKKNIIPLKYFYNKKAWMTMDLWNVILQQLDEQMRHESRKIVLFVDNAACHKITKDLNNIEIQYLPANTTALIQPLDQGIIHCFKSHYRKLLVRKQILALENGTCLKEFSRSIDLLTALHLAKRAWWLVEKKSIMGCFKKAKFYFSDEATTTNDDEEIFDNQSEDLQIENFAEYIDIDKNVECFGILNDEEIVQEILSEKKNYEIISSDEEEIQEKEQNQEEENISLKEVTEALNKLRIYALQKGLDINQIEDLEENVFRLHVKNISQSKITDYFKMNE